MSESPVSKWISQARYDLTAALSVFSFIGFAFCMSCVKTLTLLIQDEQPCNPQHRCLSSQLCLAMKAMCVCQALFLRVNSRSFHENSKAGGPWTLGWHGPTKTHPSRRVNVPAKFELLYKLSNSPCLVPWWFMRLNHTCCGPSILTAVSPHGIHMDTCIHHTSVCACVCFSFYLFLPGLTNNLWTQYVGLERVALVDRVMQWSHRMQILGIQETIQETIKESGDSGDQWPCSSQQLCSVGKILLQQPSHWTELRPLGKHWRFICTPFNDADLGRRLNLVSNNFDLAFALRLPCPPCLLLTKLLPCFFKQIIFPFVIASNASWFRC